MSEFRRHGPSANAGTIDTPRLGQGQASEAIRHGMVFVLIFEFDSCIFIYP